MADSLNWIRGLPKQFRDFLDGIVDHGRLADSWSGQVNGDLVWGKENLSAHPEVQWATRGSERAVVGLGRTYQGELLTEDRTSVVVKFQPQLDEELLIDGKPPQPANHRAIAAWKTAKTQRGEELFPELLDFGEHGRWIAVEECIPIRSKGKLPLNGRDAISPDSVKNNISVKELLRRRGWRGDDIQTGNIGIALDGRIVLLDVGNTTKYVASEQHTRTVQDSPPKESSNTDMKFTYQVSGNSVSGEVTVSEDEDHARAIERVIETLEEVKTADLVPEQSNPNITQKTDDSPDLEIDAPESLFEFARRARVDPETLISVVDLDPDEEKLPFIVEGAEELGDTKKERQMKSSLIILGLWDACYGGEPVLTSTLKDALEYSNVDSGALSNMYNVGNSDQYFDRSGRGGSATIALSRPGKREARKAVKELVQIVEEV